MNPQTVIPLAKPPDAPGARLPHTARHAAPARSAFVPVLLATVALLLGLGWQAHLLWAERGSLQAAHASQQQTVDSAGKLRTSLDTLAADTQRLADSGNTSAALLVEELRKRGVTINAQVGAAAAPAARP